MHVRLHAPLSTRVLAWHAPHPAVTVVLGATFALGDDPSLERRPIPLDEQRSGPVAPELWRASEAVPWKKSPEVLLVGHAFGEEASDVLPVRLAIGAIDKRCFAVADEPSEHLPLSSAYLRSDPRGGEPVRTAPVAPRVPGWDERALSEDVDFAAFNTAPEDQRLRALAPGMPFTLEGTLMGLGRCDAELPRFRPVAFFAPSPDPAHWKPVPLTCDTLWLDADGAVGTLVWRGVCPAPAEGTELVVGGGAKAPSAHEVAASALEPAEPKPARGPEKGRAERGGAATVRGGSVSHAIAHVPRFDGRPLLAFDVPPPRTDIADDETFEIDETTLQSTGEAHRPPSITLLGIPVEEAREEDLDDVELAEDEPGLFDRSSSAPTERNE